MQLNSYYNLIITCTGTNGQPQTTDILIYYYAPTLSITTSGGDSYCTTSPAPGTYYYSCGTIVTIAETAHPAGYYYFNCWYLDNQYDGSTTSINVNMTANHSVTAYFYYSPPGRGGGCPYVSTWNGTGYALDNNILPDSELSGGHNVNDYYRLEQPLVPTVQNGETSTYSVKISEFEHEHDYIDQVKLFAVDHAAGVNVAVSPSGEILTYEHPASPISAISNEGTNVLPLLRGTDGNYYQGYNGSYITLTFAPADVSAGAKLVIVDSDMIVKDSPVYVQVLNANGQWHTVAVFHTRINWVTDIINMTGYLPDVQGNLKVRLCFVSKDEIDYVGLDTTPQAHIQVHEATLLSAISSLQGNVVQLLQATDGKYAELLPGQQILLTYLLPTNEYSQRTFILFANGYYVRIP
jgi:hypothetical protein